MKSLRMSAISPPYAESTPGVGGMTVRRMPRSRARRQPVIGPAPPKARRVNERGSAPWRDRSFDTSRYIPEIATRMTLSAAS